MNATHNTFLLGAKTTSQALEQLLGELVKLDALWNGTPSYSTQITQAVIDSKPDLQAAGYTKAEIEDALYALALIKGAMLDHLPALSRLADLP